MLQLENISTPFNEYCYIMCLIYISRAPRTVPQSVEEQVGLGDEDLMRRAFSAPGHGFTANGLPIGSPDSSEKPV